MKEIFPGIFRKEKYVATLNLVPGYRSHSENLIQEKGGEFRIWDPFHSKPSAAIAKGLREFPLKKGSKILYLGAANGNTVSFFSDIVGSEGIIYAVEISQRSMRDLNAVALKRKNIIPILANAKLPNQYSWVEKVDILYQDVAADDQSDILIKNARFLKENGYAMIAIKARSIDVIKDPEEVYKVELKKFSKYFKILEKKRLDPFEKDHLFVTMQKIKETQEISS